MKKEEEPKFLDDFGDPRWKGRLIAEPRDYEILIASRTSTRAWKRRAPCWPGSPPTTSNFTKDIRSSPNLSSPARPRLAFTCYSHHYPSRKRKGAPVDYMLSRRARRASSQWRCMKNAPHPNTAWLFNRWAASEEGQKFTAQGGRTPAHPKVEPTENIRPDGRFTRSVLKISNSISKFEKIWKEVFKLR